ncbi:alpha-L-fucosidase [Mangrovactinospora gilvigrisea]|uniref:alpha-L-fucosidase n=1 Tax=Mangrovactinospora gilvigrisea TaxID=1428644 RepID=A0A1J7BH70_9ACTN|nr:alpha-L-fucosidase [Mangrovactinospora gilvigrisea]OIV38043.1 alpha-L-fucosidase [Mangrovactinospora gilvigrisea]
MTTTAAGRTDTTWFTEARFGLFVHWGIYSAAARHEWVKNRERLTDAQYQRYFDHFEPDLYDPEAWAEAAQRAGMRYTVLTTKHHDGFCLWDTEQTDYSAVHAPLCGRDLLRPFLDAFRSRGLRTGLYHSLIDWHHPDFPVDLMHPQRDDEEFIAATKGRDMAKYREYLHAQVTELLTRYGDISTMWFDFSYPGRGFNAKGRDDWGSAELAALVRRLQPGILINNRLDLLEEADFITPEQVQPVSAASGARGTQLPWEACQTLNGSWGYDRDNLDWKPSELLVRMLVDTVSKNGNLLLNVGPTGRGEFDPRALTRLREIGDWMRVHERSVIGAGEAAGLTAPTGCRYTRRGNRLYLHLMDWPMRHVHLEGLAGKVAYAQFLHDASEVKMLEPAPEWETNVSIHGIPSSSQTLELPIQRPDVAVPVIELFLKEG